MMNRTIVALWIGIILILGGIGFSLSSIFNGPELSDRDDVPAVELERHNCTVRSEICTQEYAPVCGWFNSSIQCIKYPCAVTAGNACGACSDPSVEYYTIGECPTG